MMKTFELKEDHLVLLQVMSWEFSDCEFGGPAVDCKRPYGNSGYQVYVDINNALQGRWEEELQDDEYTFTEDAMYEMETLHKETVTALAIVLSTRSFEPGTYVRQKKETGLDIWWLED
jgi:hypothetical protein